MSDLHDNVANWRIVQKFLVEKKIEILINCGDTCAPAMLQEMSKTFNGRIHTVFGNVADRQLELKVVADLYNVRHHGEQGQIEIFKRQIFFNHFPGVAEKMAERGGLDLVCHGHTHLKRWEKLNETHILNPGTAGGMFQYPSFSIIDLTAMTNQFIEVTL